MYFVSTTLVVLDFAIIKLIDLDDSQLLGRALDGYAATIFAYGQTGSGKTYTMSGEEEKRFSAGGDASEGLIPRSIQFLVEQVKSLSQDPAVSFTIRASYCELYNEQVYDVSGNFLLTCSPQLPFLKLHSTLTYPPQIMSSLPTSAPQYEQCPAIGTMEY